MKLDANSGWNRERGISERSRNLSGIRKILALLAAVLPLIIHDPPPASAAAPTPLARQLPDVKEPDFVEEDELTPEERKQEIKPEWQKIINDVNPHIQWFNRAYEDALQIAKPRKGGGRRAIRDQNRRERMDIAIRVSNLFTELNRIYRLAQKNEIQRALRREEKSHILEQLEYIARDIRALMKFPLGGRHGSDRERFDALVDVLAELVRSSPDSGEAIPSPR